MKAFSCDVFVKCVPLSPNAPTAHTLELCCQLLAPQSMVLSSLLRGPQAQFLCCSYRDALILFPLHTSAVSPNLRSLIFRILADAVSLILPKIPGKIFPGYRHDDGDNGKAKASVQLHVLSRAARSTTFTITLCTDSAACTRTCNIHMQVSHFAVLVALLLEVD